MHEQTFVGSTSKKIMFPALLNSILQKEPEFLKAGNNYFESEEIIDAVYRVYLTLLDKDIVFSSYRDLPLSRIVRNYTGGFYMPCTERVVLSGQVDIHNDNLVDYGGLVFIDEDTKRCRFITVKKARRKHIVVPMGTEAYSVNYIFPHDNKIKPEKDAIEISSFSVCVNSHGQIKPIVLDIHRNDPSEFVKLYRAICEGAAVVLNMEADKKYLWLVETGEQVIAHNINTPLTLGVSVEHVKSLFYARSTPLTEAGRKRPIMHWVEAHKRRLERGIDVDIRKHLRGVNAFEMAGFPFKITNPIKGSVAQW